MLTTLFRSTVTRSSPRISVSRLASARFYSAETQDDLSASIDDEPLEQQTPPPPSTTMTTSTTRDKTLDDLPITFADISRAEVAIRGGVKRTTCEKSHFISELIGANVYFKNEFRQFTGSFKERGARNAILQLMRERKGSLQGVIAASAGNHALALAYHGKELNVPAVVVMPSVAPMAKVENCRVRRNCFVSRPSLMICIAAVCLTMALFFYRNSGLA